LIGVDTNILVRYLTQDDPSQARRVDALLKEAFDANDQVYIDDVVLCEMVWVLGARYRYEKSAVTAVLDDLLETTLFAFEDRNLLRRALDAFRSGAGDFADYVIGLRNARAGCENTVTFDRALRGRAPFASL